MRPLAAEKQLRSAAVTTSARGSHGTVTQRYSETNVQAGESAIFPITFLADRKGEVLSTNPDDVSTAGANAVSDEARSERAVDRRETATRSNGDRREP